jgi:homeobox protein cut-like
LFVQVEILLAQRERLRNTLLSVEQEKVELQSQITQLGSDMAVLRQDNLHLYEKIKFLESFTATTKPMATYAPGSVGVSAHSPATTTLPRVTSITKLAELDPSAATEVKYRKLYEEAENPFVKFSQQQKQQQLQKLNPADRVTLAASSFFLGRKSLRMFLFVYMIALHLLVVGTLYFHSLSTPGQCKPTK